MHLLSISLFSILCSFSIPVLYRRLHLAAFAAVESPPKTQQSHCRLKIVCHASVRSAAATNRSQTVLDPADVADEVMIRSRIQSQQTSGNSGVVVGRARANSTVELHVAASFSIKSNMTLVMVDKPQPSYNLLNVLLTKTLSISISAQLDDLLRCDNKFKLYPKLRSEARNFRDSPQPLFR